MATDLPITECRLDLAGLREQRERYRRLGADVEETVREPQRLVLSFSAGVDEGLLRETIAIERTCCPFFAIDYRSAERRLVVGVGDPAQDPALDAIAFALGVVADASTGSGRADDV